MARTNQQEIDARKAEFHKTYTERGGKPILNEKNQKFSEMETVEGRIVRLPYPMGKSFAIDMAIQGEEGTENVSYWCPRVLQNMLKQIKEGDNIAILCVGKIPTSNGDAYDFAVSKL